MREVRIGNCRLFHGDCREVMPKIPAGLVHSVVTDPPYHLTSVSRNGSPRQNDPETPYGRTRLGSTGFMGKTWDGGGIAHSVDLWRLALDCCRPGAHLLAFAGTRTYHRLACAVEDAGFEIRDMVSWCYGSGFPKSLDVSKAIDAAAGAEREVIGTKSAGMGSGATFGMLQSEGRNGDAVREISVTAPATEEPRQWQGWGTALKPAVEPCVLARKPLIGTVAENVQRHAAGALNIDASRISMNGEFVVRAMATNENRSGVGVEMTTWAKLSKEEMNSRQNAAYDKQEQLGRFPANLIHDGSEEALAVFPQSESGQPTDRNPSRNRRSDFGMTGGCGGYADTGSAARFFYCAKASSEERDMGCGSLMTWENADLSRVEEVLNQLERVTSDVITLLRNDVEWSRISYGSAQTDQFRRVIKSIIETRIRQITESKTSNCLRHLSISDCIRGVLRTQTVAGSNLADCADCISQLIQSSTNEKMASVLGVVHAVLRMLLEMQKSAKFGNIHSTVKPVDLMRYLITLVTVKNGIVLDPFMGSGSTGIGAIKSGMRFIGIEQDESYFNIACERIAAAHQKHTLEAGFDL